MADAGIGPWLMRGTIEGFYGPPWSHRQRLEHLAFSADVGLDTYVYAPKDDPYHRRRWREPYPAEELALIAELAREAERVGVRFSYAVHPALDMRFADDGEHATLAAKAEQLRLAGVGSFALLFDDVPYGLTDGQDVGRFGDGAAGSGAAHGYTVTRFAEGFLASNGLSGPLLACPTDYAGIADSPYRDAFGDAVPADVLVAWTGSDVVVGTVTRADIDRAAASYRRPVVLWDNFPVNDFDRSRVFLGPLTGRTADLVDAPLAGVLANPMIEAVPSRIALATVADWARDPRRYEPSAALRAALDRVAGPGAANLAPLVRVCSAWPPSADQDRELTQATAAALTGSTDALDLVDARLAELGAACRAAHQPADLVAALRPWLDGAIATAAAGRAAVELQRAVASGAPAAEVAPLHLAARRALDRAEDRYENVLRPIVPAFVRAVLDRTRQRPSGA
jgi:beta-N-acetylglucosaminidase